MHGIKVTTVLSHGDWTCGTWAFFTNSQKLSAHWTTWTITGSGSRWMSECNQALSHHRKDACQGSHTSLGTCRAEGKGRSLRASRPSLGPLYSATTTTPLHHAEQLCHPRPLEWKFTVKRNESALLKVLSH